MALELLASSQHAPGIQMHLSKLVSWLALGVAALAGCAHLPQSAPSNAVVDRAGHGRYDAAIVGRAFLHLASGKVNNCRGDVQLIAATARNVEKMMSAFHTGNGGYLSRIDLEQALSRNPIDGAPRHTSCDQDGNFSFEHVAPGKYLVLAKVYWSVRWGYYGGGVLDTVIVDEAEQQHVVLTHTLN